MLALMDDLWFSTIPAEALDAQLLARARLHWRDSEANMGVPAGDLAAHVAGQLKARMLEQLQEPQRMFPLVNPTTGATMSTDTGIDDTEHVYCDAAPIYETPHYDTPSFDYGSSNCGGGCGGGFDF